MDAVSQSYHGLRRWHRRIAWVALFAVFMFALAGLLHPLVTRLQPQPVTRVPPPMLVLVSALPAPAAALVAAGVAELSGLRPVHDGARWLWRVQTAGEDVRFAGKDWRDGLGAAFAPLLIGVAIAGTLLHTRNGL